MDKRQGVQDWNRHAMGGQYVLYLLGPFLFCQYQTGNHPSENKPNIYLNQLHTQPKILGSILKGEMYGQRHALVHHNQREFFQVIYMQGRAMASCLLLQPGRAVSFLVKPVSLCPFCTTKVASIYPCSFFFVYNTFKVEMRKG